VFDFKTLTYYGVAGALSFCLSVLLFAFARYQPGTRSAKSVAAAILVLAVGYTGAAYAPSLPTWALRLGTNMMLLSAGAIMYSGYSAFCLDRQPEFDRLGWAIVGLTAIPFWYWGFVEPDGNYRSAVYSFAAAAINGRTAVVFFKTAYRQKNVAPVWFLTALFAVLTLWMSARGVLSLLAQGHDPVVRGTNPTTWTTVFAYIILITLGTVATLWLEISDPRRSSTDPALDRTSVLGSIGRARSKLLLLWGTVIALNVGILGGLGVAFTRFYDSEKAKLSETAELASEAFVQHTAQTTRRVDAMLLSVKHFYQRTRSIQETRQFLASLQFDRSLIDQISLIAPDGTVVHSDAPAANGRSVINRVDGDQIFISAIEKSPVSGQRQLTLSRRLNNPDQSFVGIVSATVSPKVFSRYYQELIVGADSVVALVGMQDRRLRARVPEGNDESWLRPIESPLWDAFSASPTGSFESTSAIDGIRRISVYRQIPDLPLLMVTGFSATDLMRNVIGRIQWLGVGSIVGLVATIILAVLLTLEIRRRDEQDRFMSMLSHELKTPLSVIRMALSGASFGAGMKEPVQRALGDMNDIIERTLQADRLQQGRVSVVPERCTIEIMLESIVVTCSNPQRIDLQIAEELVVQTDAQLLRIILGNLIENGLKYGPPDCQVLVKAEQENFRRQAGVRITVTNPPGAAGMPDPRQVFRKYYRAPAAHGKTGSGLGLHIASGFAAKIGGRLSYVPDTDTVKFELWIPR
jgi:signal transduction histidine kinase